MKYFDAHTCYQLVNLKMWTFLVIYCGYLTVSVTSESYLENINQISIYEYSKGKVPLPVFPKCCDLTQIQYDDLSGCFNGASPIFKPFVYDLDQDLEFDDYTNYTVVIGELCQSNKYSLLDDTPEVNYHILKNGSLCSEEGNILLEIGEYCLDYKNNSTNLTVFFCGDIDDNTSLLRAAACIVSIPFLIAIFFIHLGIQELRDVNGKIIAHYAAFLTIAFMMVAYSNLQYTHSNGCSFSAFIIYFAPLLAVLALSVLTFHVWLNIRYYLRQKMEKKQEKKCMIIYTALVYGVTALIFITTCFLCYYEVGFVTHVTFYIPTAIVVIIIGIFIITAATVIHRNFKPITTQAALGEHANVDESEANKILRLRLVTLFRWLMLCLFLTFIWVVEFMSWISNYDSIVWMTLDLFNSLQGVWIFVIAVVYPKDVRNRVLRWVKCDESRDIETF